MIKMDKKILDYCIYLHNKIRREECEIMKTMTDVEVDVLAFATVCLKMINDGMQLKNVRAYAQYYGLDEDDAKRVNREYLQGLILFLVEKNNKRNGITNKTSAAGITPPATKNAKV